LAYRFSSDRLNPRPQLSDAWREIDRRELEEVAPSCAAAFLRALEAELPDVARGLVLLRHPNDWDPFGVYDAGALSIQFDIHLEYIIVWSMSIPPVGGEFGDWGEGEDVQVRQAIEFVRQCVEA
jgi:hypothetical protein